MTTRRNIKLPDELFQQLKEDKGRYETWAAYFERECLTDA